MNEQWQDRLTQILAEHQRRRARKANDRAALNTARQAGLRQRHAAKLEQQAQTHAGQQQ